MTDTNTAQHCKPARMLAAALAFAIGATAIPTSVFAASGDYNYERRQQQIHQRQLRGYRYAPPPRQYRHAYRNHRRHRHDDDAGALIAGTVLGFALGAIIADSYNESRQAPPSRTYYGPVDADYPDDDDYAPDYAPVYAQPPAPFSDDWYAYCASKYRSFDPATGTFQPNVGPRKLCQ